MKMKLALAIICCCYISTFSAGSIIEFEGLINDYLNYKGTKNVVFGLCDSRESKRVVRRFSRSGFYSKVIPVDETMDRILNGDFNDTHVSFVLEVNCQHSENILEKASDLKLLSLKRHWLLVVLQQKFLPLLDRLNINLDSDIFLANTHEYGVSLMDVYHTGFGRQGGLFRIQPIGSWTAEEGLRLIPEYRIEMRSNLDGLLVKAVTVILGKLNRTTMMDYMLDDQNGYDLISKSCFQLILDLARMYNFSLQVFRTTTWGYEKNGTFDGMTGALSRKEADFGSCFYIKKDRMRYVDQVGQTSYHRVAIVFQQPKMSGSSVMTFIKPLKWNVWVYSGICLIIIAITATLTYRAESGVISRDDVIVLSRNILSETILLVISTVSLQGIAQTSRLLSNRLIILSAISFSFLIYQFYSASIVSALLTEPPKIIKTPQDFLTSDLKFLIEDLFYHRIYLSTSKYEVARQIYATKGYNGTNRITFMPPKDGFAMVRKGGYGYYFDTNNGYNVIRDTFSMREICNLGELTFDKKNDLVTIVHKGSPLRELLAVGIAKMMERGMHHREMNKWQLKRPPCVRGLSDSAIVVGFEEISSAFTFYAFGILVSFSILLLEIYYCGKFRRPQRNIGQRVLHKRVIMQWEDVAMAETPSCFRKRK